MPDRVSRRRVLAAAGGAGLTALAGCAGLNPFREKAFDLTIVRADGSETDVTCDLPDDAVREHDVLRRILERLADADPGTRVNRGLSQQRGEAIGDLLTEHCETVGGLYRYEERWYLVGISFESATAHDEHHEGQATEHTHGTGGTGDHKHTGTETEHDH